MVSILVLWGSVRALILGAVTFFVLSHFIFVRTWEPKFLSMLVSRCLSIDAFISKVKVHRCVWIGVIDILGKKHGSKDFFLCKGNR